MEKQPIGSVVWRDLTVADAAGIRDFYASVVGWETRAHPMGAYDDYDVRRPGDGDVVAGICHARGENAGIPPQWLVYVVVASVEESARRAVELGGAVLDGPRPLGRGAFCVIRDPAGAVLGLVENAD